MTSMSDGGDGNRCCLATEIHPYGVPDVLKPKPSDAHGSCASWSQALNANTASHSPSPSLNKAEAHPQSPPGQPSEAHHQPTTRESEQVVDRSSARSDATADSSGSIQSISESEHTDTTNSARDFAAIAESCTPLDQTRHPGVDAVNLPEGILQSDKRLDSHAPSVLKTEQSIALPHAESLVVDMTMISDCSSDNSSEMCELDSPDRRLVIDSLKSMDISPEAQDFLSFIAKSNTELFNSCSFQETNDSLVGTVMNTSKSLEAIASESTSAQTEELQSSPRLVNEEADIIGNEDGALREGILTMNIPIIDSTSVQGMTGESTDEPSGPGEDMSPAMIAVPTLAERIVLRSATDIAVDEALTTFDFALNELNIEEVEPNSYHDSFFSTAETVHQDTSSANGMSADAETFPSERLFPTLDESSVSEIPKLSPAAPYAPSRGKPASVALILSRSQSRKKVKKRSKPKFTTKSTERSEVESDEDAPAHRDTCSLCNQPGDLVCCDDCPRVFHAQCLTDNTKPLPPDGKKWNCFMCEETRVARDDLLACALPEDTDLQHEMFLNFLFSSDLTEEFRKPVPKSLRSYYRVVKSPIDLTIIHQKALEGEYKTVELVQLSDNSQKKHFPFAGSVRFLNDILALWHNCMGFNEQGSHIYRTAQFFLQITNEFVDEKLVPFWLGQDQPRFAKFYGNLCEKWETRKNEMLEQCSVDADSDNPAHESQREISKPKRSKSTSEDSHRRTSKTKRVTVRASRCDPRDNTAKKNMKDGPSTLGSSNRPSEVSGRPRARPLHALNENWRSNSTTPLQPGRIPQGLLANCSPNILERRNIAYFGDPPTTRDSCGGNIPQSQPLVHGVTSHGSIDHPPIDDDDNSSASCVTVLEDSITLGATDPPKSSKRRRASARDRLKNSQGGDRCSPQQGEEKLECKSSNSARRSQTPKKRNCKRRVADGIGSLFKRSRPTADTAMTSDDRLYPVVAVENEPKLQQGLAMSVPKGARFVKTFGGQFYWGTVETFRDPWFSCVYSDGDREDLNREDIDKYISDTYKLIITGVVQPEPGHAPW